jgi:hypothetical protein
MSVKQKQTTSQKKNKQTTRGTSALNINFSESEDLFLSTKGRKLRNMQKKLEKIQADEAKLKDETFTPDKNFMLKI